MQGALAVGLGGLLGALLRYAIAAYLGARVASFPAGTLAVNALGCLALGVLLAYFDERPGDHAGLRLFLAVGVLGALTTFSTLTQELFELLRVARYGGALAVLLANVVLGLGALVLGRALGRLLF